MEQTTNISLFELQVDHEASAQLKETARWAKFLAILGFIGCALMVIFALLVSFAFNTFTSRYGGGNSAGFAGGIQAFIYGVFAVVCFFPYLYLFNFASRMTKAIQSNDQERLTLSLRNLKACFRYVGILSIIFLGLMLLSVVVQIIAGTLGR